MVRVHTVGCVPTLTIPDSDADILAAALLPTIGGEARPVFVSPARPFQSTARASSHVPAAVTRAPRCILRSFAEGAVIGRAAAYLQTLDLHTGARSLLTSLAVFTVFRRHSACHFHVILRRVSLEEVIARFLCTAGKLGPRVASSQGCQLFATSGRAVICGGVNGERAHSCACALAVVLHSLSRSLRQPLLLCPRETRPCWAPCPPPIAPVANRQALQILNAE